MTVQTLDLCFQDTPGIIAAHLIQSGDSLALIETGPGSCHTALLNSLNGLGVSPNDIKHVFLTHIHLDHAGGAGWWAQQGAQVYVHGKGAMHVIDPAKLIESATRIYGDRMESLWGPILPAPAEQVTILRDGEKVIIGDIEIEAWDTPGHARHHLAYVVNDVCFTGDVAGVRLQGCDYLSVAAAPPQFEPAPYMASVDRLLAANFSKLYLAHFGGVSDPKTHLERYRHAVDAVYQNVSGWMSQGLRGEELAKRYATSERLVSRLDEAEWALYELANGTAMCAAGIELYVTKAAS
ncbi:MAG: Glyoxylase, beta-lactamase superfamily [Verrucomicrobiaceae bacterium]|nr:Glyoxylase, beta-lactamase superfamily [Verrucomicrobiaceae bacterium]